MSEAILKAKDIKSGYGSLEIIQGISLEVKKGEIVSIIGPNGSGKSTLLKTILGFVETKSGEIFFQDKNVTDYKPHQFIEEGVAYSAQGRAVFPGMTVEENLDMATWTIKDNSEKRKKAKENVYETFPFLKDKKDQKGESLSGGQRQMLSLACSVALNPDLLILDEPSLGLAPSIAEELIDRIEEVNSRGITVLIVEQNAGMALDISDRGYVLDSGEIEFTGRGHELLEDEEVRMLYLGG
ncbi:hypothetical protein AKJ49_01860 [candidate division MSBL1 archaeon SCGC-AAA382A03]|uniref:ABC transporter domain-containing protein n=1 Tax=candidate division MSBL1 archaeon SCGC-AAA382A03 TaxID=1698278 RepID=A0A133VDW1_9EURY|nr:hypothetical protein AKJ49_01860 [candidate division MSBL1 archaeon SCGC-AAA382A03]